MSEIRIRCRFILEGAAVGHERTTPSGAAYYDKMGCYPARWRGQ